MPGNMAVELERRACAVCRLNDAVHSYFEGGQHVQCCDNCLPAWCRELPKEGGAEGEAHNRSCEDKGVPKLEFGNEKNGTESTKEVERVGHSPRGMFLSPTKDELMKALVLEKEKVAELERVRAAVDARCVEIAKGRDELQGVLDSKARELEHVQAGRLAAWQAAGDAQAKLDAVFREREELSDVMGKVNHVLIRMGALPSLDLEGKLACVEKEMERVRRALDGARAEIEALMYACAVARGDKGGEDVNAEKSGSEGEEMDTMDVMEGKAVVKAAELARERVLGERGRQAGMQCEVRLVYVSGKISAETRWEEEKNIRHAEVVMVELLAAGYAVVCPHTMGRYLGDMLSHAEWMVRGLETMARCDAVVLVGGWQESKGARREVREALAAGLPVWGNYSDLVRARVNAAEAWHLKPMDTERLLALAKEMMASDVAEKRN